MFKVRRFVCLALVCALVGVAYGAARKISSFTPTAAELPTADGMVILNFVANANDGNGKTIVQMILTDFTPEMTYVWEVLSPSQPPSVPFGACSPTWFGTVDTDTHGQANLHFELPCDMSDSDILVYAYPGPGNGGLLRACGCQGECPAECP